MIEPSVEKSDVADGLFAVTGTKAGTDTITIKSDDITKTITVNVVE